MARRRSNAEIEIEVFREFAPHCPLRIDLANVESRDPSEPDIRCVLEGGEVIGFELSQLIDRDVMERLEKMFRTNQLLQSAYENGLSDEDKSAFEQRYQNTDINIVFEDNSTLRDREKLSPTLLKTLSELPPMSGKNNVVCTPLPGVNRVYIHTGELNGPLFASDASGFMTDPTEESVRKKLSKTYDCDCSIHLLLYIDIDLLCPNDSWMDVIVEAAEELLDDSPIEKIWVFDRSSNAIRFEYPQHDTS